MRDANRIDAYLDELKSIWKRYPDLRFTQLIFNCIESPFGYYIEDDRSLEILKDFYKEKENA